jgi:Ankyrin repeats (3 copies)
MMLLPTKYLTVLSEYRNLSTITEDKDFRRMHVVIHKQEWNYLVQRYCSYNSSFLDGQPLKDHLVKDRVIIDFGSENLFFECDLFSWFMCMLEKEVLQECWMKKLFMLSIWKGYNDFVGKLLEQKTVDPKSSMKGRDDSYEFYHPLDHFQDFKKQPQDKRNPMSLPHCSVILASLMGHDKIVEMLLLDKRADPSSYGNFCIDAASTKGHKAVLELLLKDTRVDPSANEHMAIKSAIQNGKTDIVEMLLKDGRTKVSLDSNAVKQARENGHIAIVELLTKHIKDKQN